MEGRESGKRAFPVIVFELLHSPAYQQYVGWSSKGDSFIMWKPSEFASAWNKTFKHNNINSFVRQLNTYGFHKVENSSLQPPAMEFRHEYFLKGRPDLLSQIQRKKPKKQLQDVKSEFQSAPPTPAIPSTPVIQHSEVEKSSNTSKTKTTLSTDEVNQFLLAEIVRLRNEQQTTQQSVSKILEQLNYSRRQQQKLQNQVTELLKQQNLQVDTLTPPASPLHTPSSASSTTSPNSNSAILNESEFDSLAWDFNQVELDPDLIESMIQTHLASSNSNNAQSTPNSSIYQFLPQSPSHNQLQSPSSQWPLSPQHQSYMSPPMSPLSPQTFTYNYSDQVKSNQ